MDVGFIFLLDEEFIREERVVAFIHLCVHSVLRTVTLT